MTVLPGFWREYETFHPNTLGMRALLRQVDSLINEAFPQTSGETADRSSTQQQGLSDQTSHTNQPGQSALPSFAPEYAVEEADQHYILSFDIPGVKKDDLNLEFSGNQLVLSGERRYESHSKGSSQVASTRRYGHFQRRIALPDGIRPDEVEADYKDGVLKVLLPKPSAAKTTKVKIGEAKGGFLRGLVSEKSPTTQAATAESTAHAN